MTAIAPLVREIPIDRIRPGAQQARKRFDEAALRELAASIAANGVVQPVVLRSAGQGFELLAGERRWRAAQLAGISSLPALIRDDLDDDEAAVLGLIENLQRESLDPIETAFGLRQLAEHYGLTHEEVSRRVGKSREYVSNALRLLQLDARIQEWVAEQSLSAGHAKVICGLPKAQQMQWAERARREQLSVRALERRIVQARQIEPSSATGRPEVDRLAAALAEHLGFPVRIQFDSSGHGELRIAFHSLDEFEGLLERVGYKPEPL
jgi:ParB family chromosome partitioning protein